MKQVLQNLRSGETYVADVPVPRPKAGMVLVRTGASLVSAGTERMVVEFAGKSLLGKARSRPDLARQVMDKARREGLLTTVEAAFNRLEQPMALGYSSSGEVVALGEGVDDLRIGEHVACAGGGYAVHAEYATVPRNLAQPLPEGVDLEQAAFTTLGAIAMHGFRLAEVELGEQVAVIGLGLLGLLAVGIARAGGCRVMGIDIDPDRVSRVEVMGGEGVARSDAEATGRSFTRGRGFDAVLICADTPSADPVELAGLIARERARVVAVGAVGLNLPRKVYYEKELTFINSRSYGPGRYDPSYEERGHDYPIGYVRWTEGRNLEAFIDLLAEGRLDVRPLITHRFPIGEAQQAYELITGKGREPYLGVLLTYPSTGEPDLVRGDGRVSAEDQTLDATVQPPISIRTDRVRLGVLGSGNFAVGVMLPAIRGLPGLELEGIASGSGMSAQSAAKRFGFKFACSDERKVLEDPDINAIAILTRHHLHAGQVLAGLQLGKHVFCEKPLAILPHDLEEIRLALTEAQKPDEPADALLTVGYNRRFAPLSIRLAEFLLGRREPLFAQYRVNAGYLPPNHWLLDPSQGGGRIIGEACHFIDFLVFLAGEPPLSVTAQGLPDQGVYREDNVHISLYFPDGSLGVVSYLANGDKSFGKERLEVFCGGRVGVLDDFRSLELIRDGHRRVFRSRLRQDKGHRAIWQAFIQAIVQGREPPIPYEQLLGVSQAAFAAVESLRSGGTSVPLAPSKDNTTP